MVVKTASMNITSVDNVYQYLSIEKNYKHAIKMRVCKIILGSSVIRAFKPKTKADLLISLIKIDFKGLYSINSEKKYDAWHKKRVDAIYKSLLRNNEVKFKDDLEGLKWGHATKILNLYIGHLLYYSPYFGNAKYINRIYTYLHTPLDSKVFKVLKKSMVATPKSIKSIRRVEYLTIQQILREKAKPFSIASIVFDEYAWAVS